MIFLFTDPPYQPFNPVLLGHPHLTAIANHDTISLSDAQKSDKEEPKQDGQSVQIEGRQAINLNDILSFGGGVGIGAVIGNFLFPVTTTTTTTTTSTTAAASGSGGSSSTSNNGGTIVTTTFVEQGSVSQFCGTQFV